jgi:histidine triad (HIT) family protein
VVPKQQTPFLWDLDDETYQNVMMVAKKIARHMRETLGVEYVGSQVIGVDVPHAHVHLIPFNDVSEYHNVPDNSADPNHGALGAVAKKLQM